MRRGPTAYGAKEHALHKPSKTSMKKLSPRKIPHHRVWCCFVATFVATSTLILHHHSQLASTLYYRRSLYELETWRVVQTVTDNKEPTVDKSKSKRNADPNSRTTNHIDPNQQSRQTLDESTPSNDHPAKTQKQEGCWRPCPQGRPNIMILQIGDTLAQAGAGLWDRTSLIHSLSNIAGYLCAHLFVPPPSILLSAVHNSGSPLHSNVTWDDFGPFVYENDQRPAVYEYGRENNDSYDTNDDHSMPLASDTFVNYPYNLYTRIKTGRKKSALPDFVKFEKMVEAQVKEWWLTKDNKTIPPKHHFIWQLHIEYYHWNGYLQELFSKRLKSEDPKLWQSLPQVHPRRQSGDSDACCVYSVPHPTTLSAIVKDRIRDTLHGMVADPSSNNNNNTIVGSLHIRRGDAVNQCDTSLERMQEFFHCSFAPVANSLHLIILLWSDERNVCYRQALKEIVKLYNHTLVDLDDLVRATMARTIIERSLPQYWNNNMQLFQIVQSIVYDKTFLLQFWWEKRRSMACSTCGWVPQHTSPKPNATASSIVVELPPVLENYETCMGQQQPLVSHRHKRSKL